MTDLLAEIKARWESKHPPLSPQIDWLIGEVEDLRTQLVGALDGWRTESRTATERGREVERLQRFEAMWEDCVKHRDQAEQRARRYMDLYHQFESIVHDQDNRLESDDER
jgi:hypothetical protein